MKKSIFYIFISLASLVMSGCSNDLDLTPDGRIPMSEVWGDQKKSEAYLNSCYGHLPDYGLDYFYVTMLDGCSDCAWDSDYTEGQLLASTWYNGGMTNSGDPTAHNYSPYYSGWNGIRQCNVFLANLDNCAARATDKPRFKAEATILRDFYYYEMCKKYGPQPLTRTPFNLTTDFARLTRPNFQEVSDFISEDVDATLKIDNFPWRIKSESERGRYTKAIAITLKSEITLLSASPLWNPTNDKILWTKARDAAKDAIDQLTANGYALYYSSDLGDASYANYFYNQSDINNIPRDRETIMENQNAGSMNSGGFAHCNAFPQRNDKLKAGNCPTQEMVDAYDMQATGLPVIDPANRYSDDEHLHPNYIAGSGYDLQNPYVGRDPRFYATVLFNGSKCCTNPTLTVESYVGGLDEVRNNSRLHTFTGYYLNKFINDSIAVNNSSSGPWKRMRLAELYLNYAEAENEVNGPDDAVYSALKVIRDRVNMPNVKSGLSQGQMREYIRKERWTEFAFEENRFWDVRRWKILDKTDKLSTGMRITPTANNSWNYERFVIGNKQSWSAKFLIFPIPVDDASIMNWQNPGW